MGINRPDVTGIVDVENCPASLLATTVCRGEPIPKDVVLTTTRVDPDNCTKASRDAVAHLLTTYPVNITQPAHGTIEILPINGINYESFPYGTVAELEIIPDTGYELLNWTDDAEGSELNISISIYGTKIIGSTLGAIQLTLDITIGDNGDCSTDPPGHGPGNIRYDYGTEVTITPTANEGFAFSGWSGDVPEGQEGDDPLVLTITQNLEITANFRELGGEP